MGYHMRRDMSSSKRHKYCYRLGGNFAGFCKSGEAMLGVGGNRDDDP